MMRLMDRCRCAFYRPDAVVHYRLPEADSVSALDLCMEQALQVLACAQHLRVTCADSGVRRCARAREGWTLRRLAGYLREAGRDTAALSLVWQAFWVYPTFGAAAALAGSPARASLPRR